MCLTAEALALFLNIIGPEIVTAEPGRITVHAAAGDAQWVAAGTQWCTRAPQTESAARFRQKED